MKRNKGFTLIEILIVIVILGIVTTFALLGFGDFGGEKRLLFSLNQLENTLELAQQKAILECTTLGLRIDNSSYQILQYNNQAWNAISDKGVFKIHYFPKNTYIYLKTKDPHQSNAPSIIITGSGKMTPFEIQIGTSKESIVARLVGNSNGSFTTNPEPSK